LTVIQVLNKLIEGGRLDFLGSNIWRRTPIPEKIEPRGWWRLQSHLDELTCLRSELVRVSPEIRWRKWRCEEYHTMQNEFLTRCPRNVQDEPASYMGFWSTPASCVETSVCERE
jgi:hypothetical protein